jgi:hypothetical protein
MDERLERAPFGVLTCSPDGSVRAANDAARTVLDLDPDRIDGAEVLTVFPRSVSRSLAHAFEGDEVTADEFEEYYPELERWLAVSVVPLEGGVTVYVEDVSERRSVERAVEETRAELERLGVLSRLVSGVLTDVVAASERAEVADRVCRRLGETDLYEFAWVGQRAIGDDDVVVRANAGAPGRTFEAIRDCLDGSATLPERRAIETGEIRTVDALANGESVPEPVRRAAFAEGLQSMVAIPVTYGEEVHGVVGVYATERRAFSPRELVSFETLGEVAGLAVNASRTRTLLQADSVVELTVAVPATTSPLAATTEDGDVALSLDATVAHDARGLIGYLTVTEGSPAGVVEAVGAVDGVAVSRVLDGAEGTGSVEAEFGDETPLGVCSSLGVTVRSATFESGTCRLDVELPPDADVRRLADTVTRRLDATVVAKRERERAVTPAGEFRDELRDRLTERQETALRTAFFADYFESPRGSTAEEVADALDITGSTLLYHLRAGQRKLLDAFLDEAALERESTDGRGP